MEVNSAENRLDTYIESYNYSRCYVLAKVEVQIYRLYPLDIFERYNEYEAELLEDLHDEGDPESPLPIEFVFSTNECSVCLSASPNILLFPCLHKTVCFQCEQASKLISCPSCREKIIRKVKI